MAKGFSIRLDGAEEALDGLGSIFARLEDQQPMWDAIGEALVVSTQQRFDREESPEGSPWPKSIRAILQSGQTLTDTARLKQPITHVASGSGVEVGSNVLYSTNHQLGGTIRPVASEHLKFRLPDGRFVTTDEVTIPARPFLGLDDDDTAEIAKIVEDSLGSSNND